MTTRERERAEQFISYLRLHKRRLRSGDESLMAYLRRDSGEGHELLLEFDRDSGVSGIRMPEATLRHGSPLLQHMQSVEAILRLHTMVSRLAIFDPASYGLVSAQGVTPRRFRYSGDRLEMYADCLIQYNLSVEDLLATEVIARIPKSIKEPNIVWHARQANVQEFGTPFLAPYTSADADIEVEEDEEDGMQEGWAVFQTGLENATPLAVAAWNDAAGLRNLVEQVTGHTAESALAMRALGSKDESGDIQDARYEFLRATSLAQAQLDWSPDKALRPVLAMRALKATGAAQDAYRMTTWRLNAKDILCKANGGVIGLVYAPPRSWNTQSCREFVADLQGHLDERDLGHALLVNDRFRRMAVVIVKDREFFERYAPVCGFLPSAEAATRSVAA